MLNVKRRIEMKEHTESIPMNVTASEMRENSMRYCPTQDQTSPAGSTTPFVAPKAQPIVHTDPSDLTGMAGLEKGGKG
jgi:hypothetical protein